VLPGPIIVTARCYADAVMIQYQYVVRPSGCPSIRLSVCDVQVRDHR